MAILNVKFVLCLLEHIVARKFGKCSRYVKVLLFKSRCSCFYNIALWKYHNIASVNKLKLTYNNCIKLFLDFVDVIA